ncbi:hypothetical protein CAPTEDRAFT_133058 [Capitella teleta]|uniref:Vacuolar protein sorting-associated protein 33B n=1 Tax=Capitella teleta TaxID=283909 RepID=N1PBD6_CAPTE|nr:hypothetical protein CAPTEDRAFT_133058 [Capitella teleta]|eukprot:ELU18869.1 hypothetical protein CAPTEDRAFT_133058 [Capitella teleta]
MAGTFSGVELPEILVLRQLARDQLIFLYSQMTGRKDLVLDTQLMRPLDRLAGAALLKEHGVDKIFKLEPGKSLAGCDQRIFIIRPQMQSVKMIADQINADRSSNIKRAYRILMAPRKIHACDLILEQEGVYGYVTTEEFQWDLIPLDKDILSLELPEFLPAFFLENDQTWVHTVARSLVTVQQVFGRIPNVYGVGKCAQMVEHMAELMFSHVGEPQQVNSEIGSLVLVDRSVDYVTPLLSQVTYEGLLDDMFRISCGYIEFPPAVSGKDTPTKMILTCSDSVYEEIRNRHFSGVFSFLSGKAKELQSGYDKRHDLKSVRDMKNFVSNDLRGLKSQHKSLTLHVGACEFITNQKTKSDFDQQLQAEHSLLEGTELKENISYLEEIINRQLNSTTCLRLLTLMSLTQGGLPAQVYKSLQTQYMHSFGFEHMLTFHNLRKLGMLTEVEQSQASRNLGKMAAVANVNLPKSGQFRNLCKKLHLVPKSADDINLRNPNDMSYVYSGAYTPLVCKLVEQILSKEGFTGLEDIMRQIPSPHFAKHRAQSARGGKHTSAAPSPGSRIVMVYFLGGCSHSEITALRFLGKQRGQPVNISFNQSLNTYFSSRI